MATVPQPYSYPIVDILGGVFDAQKSDHLIALIRTFVPSGINPVVSSDDLNVVVGFDQDLTEGDKAVLDSLVSRSAEYLVVTLADGTPLPVGSNGPSITLAADGIATQAMRVQLKNGDGTDSSGNAEKIILAPVSLIPLDKLSGNLDANGQFAFTLQASNARGNIQVDVKDDNALPINTFFAVWQ